MTGGGVFSSMTDLNPCLFGCDAALAEADMLIAMLCNGAESLDPELSAVRLRIAALRNEVERLRGMPALPTRRKIHPDWIGLTAIGSPWALGGDHLPTGQVNGI